MYLQRLELQGFKSFAPKTGLQFLLPKNGSKGITAIVGPNGSGKSNLSDAIRWVMGEQSMKTIRGKRSEDIIFSGTDKKSKASFAEVSLVLNNEEQKTDTPYSEIVLTRRFFRNGESEYILNKNKARLTDFQLLIAKAGIGSRSYSIIGQGTIDKILTLSEEERKDFFNEAAGIRQYQIKKEQSTAKLDATNRNLEQVEIVLRELEPRLRLLNRQAKKLEERETIEKELRNLEYNYYSSLWKDLENKIKNEREKLFGVESKWRTKHGEIQTIQKEFDALRREKSASETFLALQKKYQEFIEEKNKSRDKEWELKNLIAKEQMKETGKTNKISMPESVKELAEIGKKQQNLLLEMKKILSAALEGLVEIESIKQIFAEMEEIGKKTDGLAKKMAGEQEPTGANAKLLELKNKILEINANLDALNDKILSAKNQMEELAKKETEDKDAFFEKQKKLQGRQNEIFSLEQEINNLKIEIARLETKEETLESEMGARLLGKIRAEKPEEKIMLETLKNKDEIQRKILTLRHSVEMIGGIDPETPKEHKEIGERFNFLSKESEDLKNSTKNLLGAVKELDEMIEKQFKNSFSNINEHFDKYFKMLFGGGSAKITRTPKEAGAEEESMKGKAGDYTIEIQVSPPGKKIKSLEVLSGGEKALTAIALLCAIMANNPSPFVILDEVDAALDESNSIKFANILEELSKNTQFVVITHNRATMEKASILYGVTMEVEGVSKLLSVKLDEAENRPNFIR